MRALFCKAACRGTTAEAAPSAARGAPVSALFTRADSICPDACALELEEAACFPYLGFVSIGFLSNASLTGGSGSRHSVVLLKRSTD